MSDAGLHEFTSSAQPDPSGRDVDHDRALGIAVALLVSAGPGFDELATAADLHGVAVRRVVAPDADPGLLAALVELIEDETIRAICLDAETLPEPRRFLDAAAAARGSGKALVVLRSISPDLSQEIRFGLTRRRMIETALTAHGVVVVDRPASAVVLADILARHPRDSLAQVSVEIVADGLRPLARATSLLATRSGGIPETEATFPPNRSTVIVRLEDTTDASRSPPPRSTVLRLLVGDDPLSSNTTGEPHLTRVEDAVDVVAGIRTFLRHIDAPGEPIALDDEIEFILGRLPIGTLDPVDAIDLATASGLRCLPFVTVRTGAEAVARALDLGFPVVAKAIGRQIEDKTAAGGIALAISRMKDLRRTIARFHGHFGEAFAGAMLQPHVEPRLEIEVASFHDPDWGAFVLVRSAGVWRTAFDDTVVAPAPLTPLQAHTLVANLQTWPLLERDGGPAVDGVVEAVVAVGRLAAALGSRLPDFALHPLAVLAEPNGPTTLDVRARLAPAPAIVSDDEPLPPPRRIEGHRATFPPGELLLDRRRGPFPHHG